ncbi:MAG: tRNA (adenosine(37)-N6)-threonylcarbamoyltransferase complex transferase subunit TsaD [Campylobacterota bacterium]|nr:tRNA (adenosine(37)-N6)-threonylcarbamoyltransferase complex transferase subunit TsaD [Campylobacterota bacterium]
MILSIESSCDDSSIAITDIETKELIFHKKISQELEHSVYGGVVPELAARLHIEALPKILEECIEYLPKLKAIAVTNAPGLSVTLTEGVTMAKALAITLNLPLIAVNHLKGHIYSLFIEKEELLPSTILLVSGGHTQLIEARSLNDMKIIGSSMDDSFGESFDKVSKMMNLGYPGGPVVQNYALKGDKNSYELPIPLRQSPKIEFSYSGLKNAVRMAILKEEDNSLNSKLNKQTISNICASFQHTAVAHIMMKLKKYFKKVPPKRFAIVGGASANIELRTQVEELCNKYNAPLLLAPLEFCSDNAAMIGRVAVEQYLNGEFTDIDNIDIQSRIKGDSF